MSKKTERFLKSISASVLICSNFRLFVQNLVVGLLLCTEGWIQEAPFTNYISVKKVFQITSQKTNALEFCNHSLIIINFFSKVGILYVITPSKQPKEQLLSQLHMNIRSQALELLQIQSISILYYGLTKRKRNKTHYNTDQLS